MQNFKGQIIHPQTWSEDLDYAAKRVVVIGPGVTAAALISVTAGDCSHVRMLQRLPTFFRTGRDAIPLSDELHELGTDETWIHEIVRRKILHEQAVFTGRSFIEPEVVKQELLAGVRVHLGADYDLDTHFTPRCRRGDSAPPLCPTATSWRRSAAHTGELGPRRPADDTYARGEPGDLIITGRPRTRRPPALLEKRRSFAATVSSPP
jgi:cation diffusion facilitator CzcD-associated flavoprotein CzcO